MAEAGERTGGLRAYVKHEQDVIGGLGLAVIALVGLWAAWEFPFRRGFSFTAGTAPKLFAGLLLLVGLAIAARGLMRHGPALERYRLREPLFIMGAVILFAVAIRPLGLAITGVVTLLLASFAVRDARLGESLIFAVLLTGFCVLLFPVALSQPIPIWPSFRF